MLSRLVKLGLFSLFVIGFISLSSCSTQRVKHEVTDVSNQGDLQIATVPNETQIALTHDDEGIRLDKIDKQAAISGLLADGEEYLLFFPGARYPITAQEIIEKGFTVVIPYDITTGNTPMQFTEEWTSGGLYRYLDAEKSILILHRIGCKYSEIDDRMYKSNGIKILKSGITFNGKSEISEMAGWPLPDPYQTRLAWSEDTKTDEQLWMQNVQGQVMRITSQYSMNHKNIKTSLDAYLSWVGEKNPAAFINPYTKSPMQSLPPAQTNNMANQGIIGINPDFVQNPDPAVYAGNYSEYVGVNDKGDSYFLVNFYYLGENGELLSMGAKGLPRKYWRNTVMHWMGQSYEGD
jgi:hypothetical protein